MKKDIMKGGFGVWGDILVFEGLAGGAGWVLESFEEFVAEVEACVRVKCARRTISCDVELLVPLCIAGEMAGSLERRNVLIWFVESIHFVLACRSFTIRGQE